MNSPYRRVQLRSPTLCNDRRARCPRRCRARDRSNRYASFSLVMLPIPASWKTSRPHAWMLVRSVAPTNQNRPQPRSTRLSRGWQTRVRKLPPNSAQTVAGGGGGIARCARHRGIERQRRARKNPDTPGSKAARQEVVVELRAADDAEDDRHEREHLDRAVGLHEPLGREDFRQNAVLRRRIGATPQCPRCSSRPTARSGSDRICAWCSQTPNRPSAVPNSFKRLPPRSHEVFGMRSLRKPATARAR